MFSGGLDSTGVFWKLVQEKKQIHVHHMNLINKENRCDAEKLAVQNICNYMKKITEFTYSESTHNVPSIRGSFMWDSDMYNFIAGYICMMRSDIENVALGLTKTDLGSGSGGVQNRINRGNKILNCFTDIKKIYPVSDMSKQQIFDMLPNDLRDLTWSCRTPIYIDGVPKMCNKCKTCRELRHITFPKPQ